MVHFKLANKILIQTWIKAMVKITHGVVENTINVRAVSLAFQPYWTQKLWNLSIGDRQIFPQSAKANFMPDTLLKVGLENKVGKTDELRY
jgi:hypothetical protein